ncbi:hypothetical protein TNCV_5083231 [Trichonephila clavipes]|nr:hypothetical protein TNCV_5083231 [Trichonephila clavipes]
MVFLGKRKKQDMLQLVEELGVDAISNMTVHSIKIALTNNNGYEEEFVKTEHALKENELQLKFDLERFKVETGHRVNDEL